MHIVRWILVLPGAVLCGMLGSLCGGIVAAIFGQAASDTSSAFFGPFTFVCAAGVIAPLHRGKVTLAAAAVVALLVLLEVVLGVFTSVKGLASLPLREMIVTPVAQLLGALYAMSIRRRGTRGRDTPTFLE